MQIPIYELEIFDDVINGDLEPEKLYEKNLDHAIGYLKEQVEKCEIITLGVFKSKNKNLHLIERIELSNAHPLVYKYINQNTLHETEDLLDQIPNEALEKLQVSIENTNSVHIKKMNSKSLIGFKKTSEWQNLDDHHIKYCFYNIMLSKYVKEIKRTMSIEFYKLENPVLERYVDRTHNKIINYCIDAIEKYDLSINDLDLKAKEKYTDKDCMALVYLHLNDLVNYLYNQYGNFINQDAHILYNARILNRNKLQESAKETRDKVKSMDIDQDLKDPVIETINKLLNIDIDDRITYHDLHYYKYFIHELNYFISKKPIAQIGQNQLEYRLIELGFNNYDFIKFCIKTVEKKLKDTNDTKYYLKYLKLKRKEWSQCMTSETHRYINKSDPIKASLLCWINDEIKYRENQNTHSIIDSENEFQLPKIKVNTSVSQLALLTRLFHDTNVNDKNSIGDLAKWYTKIFETKKSKSISLDSFKNNMYTIDNGTIDEVKTRIINMLNQLQKL
ncbi:MAG: hypothetical protein WEA99_02855 [Brumimicrobium sp.]